MIYNADCLTQLISMDHDTVDSLITDPPAGISFMGKSWDGDKGGRDQWIAWMTEVMTECFRVLKPGAHGLVWALPRTSHWTATALEDAGFEVRDVITHLFGSGFPKSHDISNGIDKQAGAEREVVGERKKSQSYGANEIYGDGPDKGGIQHITAAATAAAKQWQGWGTALKPASEHWILIRKPCEEKTVASNVIKWGTGALNIDASRVEASKDYGRSATNSKGTIYAHDGFEGKAFKMVEHGGDYASPLGRFPANLVLSHSEHCEDDRCDMFCPISMLDEQSGVLVSKWGKPSGKATNSLFFGKNAEGTDLSTASFIGDKGGASRFYYCAKVSKAERNAGLEGMPTKTNDTHDNPSRMVGSSAQKAKAEMDTSGTAGNQNHHPTVKPQKIMEYLIKLITPPGGVVLDPFMGSGSTGVACKTLGFNFIGIEKEREYFEIAEKRIAQ